VNRHNFHKLFKTAGPAILPVIHALSYQQTAYNVGVAMRVGAQGVFLINHDFEFEEMIPIIREIRIRFQWLWLGVSFPGVTGKDAFPILGDLEKQGLHIDAYWAANARIDETSDKQTQADEIKQLRDNCGWSGMYFGGTAFKMQREVDAKDYKKSASLACQYMDVVTTSGVATKEAADFGKIQAFRDACNDHPLAVAAGITPDNVAHYAPLLDAILVDDGINFDEDCYNINPEKLQSVLQLAREACFIKN